MYLKIKYLQLLLKNFSKFTFQLKNNTYIRRKKLKIKIMKNYTFIYSDAQGNELTRKEVECFDDKEAYKLCQILLAECMINDCTEVYFLD